jgi:hypothetical protein
MAAGARRMSVEVPVGEAMANALIKTLVPMIEALKIGRSPAYPRRCRRPWLRRSAVGEARREALNDPERPVVWSEQRPARVRGDRTAIKIHHHRTLI